MKQVREHTCFQEEHPLSPIGCNCRKYVNEEEASKLISEGLAQLVVSKYTVLTVEESCPTCGEDEKLKRSCTHCRGTGSVQVEKKIPVYGEDIITTVGSTGKRQSNTTAKKTPRSPTIEEGHIERSVGAYGKGAEAAVDRINEYELLTLKERIRLLVIHPGLQEFEDAWRLWQADTSKDFPLALRNEPDDDAKKGEGRRFDYGRSI